MSEDKREKIARALLVTGHPLPALDSVREDRSEDYDRAIARVRAGLGLQTPNPSQEPAPQQVVSDGATDGAGQEAPRPGAADHAPVDAEAANPARSRGSS